MRTSENLNEIAPALIKAQSEMGAATKTSNNPYFHSKYADIQAVLYAVLPALLANGICVLQSVATIDGKPFMTTRLQHSSGQFMEDTSPILFDASPRADANGKAKSQNLAQVFGSAITYMRRYCLTAFLCIPQADDDGESAGSKEPAFKIVEKISLDQQQIIIDLFAKCNESFQDKVWDWLKKEYGKNFLWKDLPAFRFDGLVKYLNEHINNMEVKNG